jgi:hypothetical protein
MNDKIKSTRGRVLPDPDEKPEPGERWAGRRCPKCGIKLDANDAPCPEVER